MEKLMNAHAHQTLLLPTSRKVLGTTMLYSTGKKRYRFHTIPPHRRGYNILLYYAAFPRFIPYCTYMYLPYRTVYSIVYYNGFTYSSVQHSTVRYGTVRYGMEQ